jgi:hypothetical protein
MNTISTATARTTTTAAPAFLQRLLQSAAAKLRRAFELAGAPYADGHVPPM